MELVNFQISMNPINGKIAIWSKCDFLLPCSTCNMFLYVRILTPVHEEQIQ